MATVHPIEFEGLSKRFGDRTVLDDLSFHVPEGAIVGLLGPNGAGKSTAMRVLLGLLNPSSGHARVLGAEAGEPGFRDAVRRVGTIIEAPPLYKNATALQNLEIRVSAFRGSTGDPRIRESLHQVGLAERAGDKVGEFSLGMRQRMGLALALVGDPSIVVLDEPTNGLDPQGTVEVRNLVRSLPERNATTLLCTHRLAEVEATCDYVVVLRQGSLVTQGSLQDVVAGSNAGGHVIGVAAEHFEITSRVLADLGLGEVRVVEGALRTTQTIPDPERITRALADQGVYLQELTTHRATLEEAFLELTVEAEPEAPGEAS
jgi:ABC-type multidrug transport system ATPase subunit